MASNPKPDFRKEIREELLRDIPEGSVPSREASLSKTYYKDKDGEWHKADSSFVNGTYISGMNYKNNCHKYREAFNRPIPQKPFQHLAIHYKNDLLRQALRTGKPIPEEPTDNIEILT